MIYKLATVMQFSLGTTACTAVYKTKGKIVEVISHSIQLDQKLKFISQYVGKQG